MDGSFDDARKSRSQPCQSESIANDAFVPLFVCLKDGSCLKQSNLENWRIRGESVNERNMEQRRSDSILRSPRPAINAIQWELRRLIVCRTYSKHTKTIVETTKGRKTRVIPLSPQSLNQLKDLLESHHHELVFCQTDGEPFSQDQIRWAFHSACRKAEVSEIPFHSIRHSFATHFLFQGGGALELKKVLGHSRIETTERYTHLTDEHLALQMSKLRISLSSKTI